MVRQIAVPFVSEVTGHLPEVPLKQAPKIRTTPLMRVPRWAFTGGMPMPS